MRVVIAGGGISGLALAIELQHRGVEVEVLEQADAFTEVGAGIFLMANALKALRHLGVDVAERSVETELLAFCDLDSDELLYTTNVARAARRYGAPAYFVHRADILAALVDGVDGASLRSASRVVGIEQGPDRAAALLADGERVEGDVVVGADGLNSTVRASLFGRSEPEFSGIVAWRSIIPFERVADLGLEPACQHLWLGARRTTISYPLRRNELYNFVGIVPAEEVTPESWNEAGNLDDLRASFAAANPRLAGIVEAIDSAFVTGLYYRPPLPEWGVGRVGLIGDAAHPALPTAGQGAAMGLEDTVILADCLARHGAKDAPRAFEEFAARRRDRTGRILAISRANAEMLTFDTPELSRARNGRWRGMRELDPDSLDFWHWMWSYDVDAELKQAAAGSADSEASGAEAPLADSPWNGVLMPADRALGWVGERSGYERFWELQAPPPNDVRLREIDLGGIAGLEVSRLGSPQAPVVLHLHGGGFTMGSARSSAELADRLAAAVGGSAFLPDYRLAPEFPFPAALEDVVAACRWLLDRVGPESVLLTGEGAGGGLALGAALSLRDAGDPLPRAIYLASPFADLGLGGESIDGSLGTDAWHSRETLSMASASYLQGADPRSAETSPAYADLTGLPPILIHAAAGEALADDARRLATRAERCGVEVSLRLSDHGIHSFVLFSSLADSPGALEEVSRWFTRKVSSPGAVDEGAVPRGVGD
ncbi:MAG: alpha/beta hydrolase fold domain-containing protein [Actinobacteria bacterium]|nr:alpha/beta hydrolase fold domain-containing protein [Actinomycetota bacterium]